MALSSEGKRIRGSAGVKARKRRLARTNGLCERCLAKGRVTLADEVDHETPLSRGGTDTDDNTRNLCRSCHDEAGGEQFGRKQVVGVDADGWPLAQPSR